MTAMDNAITDNMVFVCDEITPEMIALDEMLSVDDLSGCLSQAISADEDDVVEIVREITIDPSQYRSPNYQPQQNIPSTPNPEDDGNDDLGDSAFSQDGAVAMDAARPGSKASIGCNTTFANCQAKNPLLCPWHGAKLIEADIGASLAQTIPGATVSVSSSGAASQGKGKNFSISIKVPTSQKLAAESALDDFLKQPGIKAQGLKDWDPRSGEWSEFYDIDLLQTNQAPQGGMANRAALSSSVVNSASTPASTPSQPAQQTTTATSPAQNNLQNALSQKPKTKARPKKPYPVKPQSANTASPQNGQQPAPGYQALTSVADDRKFLTDMKGKASANELADLEDLIDEKEQLEDQIESAKLAMANGSASDAQMYQDILDYALGGLKDVDEKVLNLREDINRKVTPPSWMVPGQNGKQTIANMQALGCTFIPQMLNGVDSRVEKTLKAAKPYVESMINTKLTNVQYDKLCKDVRDSMLDMFSRCELKTYKSYDAIDKFMGHKSYSMPFDVWNWHRQDKQDYGVTSMEEKEQHICSTMVAAEDDYRCGQNSKKTMRGYGNNAIVWRSDRVVGAYMNRNWCGTHSNNYEQPSLISNPQLCSCIDKYYNSSKLITAVYNNGAPILGASSDDITKYLTPGGDHNECQLFLGGSRIKAEHGEDNLKCVSAFEFASAADANKFIRAHKTELKKYGITVYGNKKEIKF